MLKALNGLLAVIGGVGGVLVLFWALNALVERLGPKWEARLKPYVFVGPAVLVVSLFLVYPTVRTVILSFADARSESFIGTRNYSDLLGEADFRQTLVNNLLWLLVVPSISLAVGLAVAVLADKLRARAENITKSVIFLPMAISFVGASTIWKFVYESRAAGRAQIGLLNGVVTGLGFDPVGWLQTRAFNFNDSLLMVIMIWLQAGFAMVLLSAAIKNVPDETLEAARIDGATELQIFFRVVVPQIWATVLVVFTTILILVMKIFDIVYVMTNGAFDTEVVANVFYKQLFEFGNNGAAAAVVVVLMVAVIPLMVYQVRRLRSEEAGR